MKAVVYREYGGDLSVADVPKPEVKKENTMIVRVKAAGQIIMAFSTFELNFSVNPVDWKVKKGIYNSLE